MSKDTSFYEVWAMVMVTGSIAYFCKEARENPEGFYSYFYNAVVNNSKIIVVSLIIAAILGIIFTIIEKKKCKKQEKKNVQNEV